jgi:hypothetical protein
LSHEAGDIADRSAEGIRSEVRKRVQLFARLRSARRVLAASMISLQDEDQPQLGRTLREALDSLSKQAASLDEPNDGDRLLFSSSLNGIDLELENSRRFLLDCADEVGPSKLRSTLPRVQQQHPGEVMALLELLLSDRDAILTRIPIIEYLITLLSTREHDGRRSISQDPAVLTSELKTVAVELERSGPIDTSQLELEFFQASSLDPSDASASEIAGKMRQRKQELGINILLPSMLRAVVTYNTRMFNRLHDDLEASRQSDAELGRLQENCAEIDRSDPIDAGLGGEPWAGELHEPRVRLDDAEGIALVHEAILRRMKGIAIGSCTSERIALALDLSCLQEEDVDALRADCEAGDTADLVIKTLVVGLLLKDLPALEADLATLEIDPHQVQTDWVRELDERLQARTSDCLAKNAYGEACQLTEAKTRFLHAPLSSLNRARTQLQSSATARGGFAASGEDAADLQNFPPLQFIEDSGWSWAVHGRLARMVATAALVVTIGVYLWPGSTLPEIHHLSNDELALHSSYIRSAYRDGFGEGYRLVGRLGSDWDALEPGERREVAQEIAEEMSSHGILDLMLYDEQLALQIHYANEMLRKPAAADDSEQIDSESTSTS